MTELFFSVKGRNSLLRVLHDTKNPYNNDFEAILLYTTFMSLHPFEDGNGRAGRLMYEYLTLAIKGKSEKMILLDYNDDLLKHPTSLVRSSQHSAIGRMYIDFFDPNSAEDLKTLTQQMYKVYKGI